MRAHRYEHGQVARVTADVDATQAAVVADLEAVCRRVCGAELRRAWIGEHEARSSPVRHRPLAGDARRVLRPAEVIDPHGIAFPLGHHLIAHDDALLLARIDRKDPRAKQSVPHPLDERRIPLAPNDLFVDAPRVGRAHRLTGDELSVDRELEILERGALRQRKHVVRFADSSAIIDKALLDLVSHDAGRPIADELRAHVAAHAHNLRIARPHRHRRPYSILERHHTRPRHHPPLRPNHTRHYRQRRAQQISTHTHPPKRS